MTTAFEYLEFTYSSDEQNELLNMFILLEDDAPYALSVLGELAKDFYEVKTISRALALLRKDYESFN